MNITFLGGTQTVTGSKYLVETQSTKILIDCGLFQGYKWLRQRNREPLPLDIATIDAIILTHAHLDHSGYIPAFYKKGYRGPVYTHPGSLALCEILLPDSGHIQEEDAKFYKKHQIGKHDSPEPLYDEQTAKECLSLFHEVDFEQPFKVGDVEIKLQSAGHILGASSVIIKAQGKVIGFSGDVGRPDDIVMHPPSKLPKLDLLLLESTYGDRLHSREDPYHQLAKVVNDTAHKGGVLLIPSFCVGRAQTLQYMLARLIVDHKIPKLPIYIDSPMAIKVSDIYCRHRQQHKLNTQQCQLMEAMNTYVKSVEDSKALAGIRVPHIIIAGSGMATGGRILHHMKHLLSDHRTTLLFSGYQAGGTRGAKLIRGEATVKIHGDWIPVKAKVDMIEGLSAHGDHQDILNWLMESDLDKNTPIILVHGEEPALESFRDYLNQHSPFQASVATYKSILRL
ncbi:MBL fold metallo-hydrolase RNA specificity domain-containing protein [Paraferrimonas sp. SM1919]|uniref:MBL fold metallo-hydrolase RNA specificity domain-containing protein n=1 Tax=Paraferrimonas sp. SM1919 TaxID=2662263 RepID=UPI0013D85E40|nr:MBL fold metallo-hydrolase [Paraferrimonas sp. SM1919]